MIELEDADGVALVRLAHGKVNALDLELLREITATFRALDAGDHRAVVLTGSGRAFSAGVDLWRIVDGGAEYVDAYLPALNEAFKALFTVGKPVVAAVNGHAIAGGCVLVGACDHRIMGEHGRIGVTELLVGVPFPILALEILQFAMGRPPARRAVLSGAVSPPADALREGLVDELVPADEVVPAALDRARRLADEIPADAFRFTKRQLRADAMERAGRLGPADAPEVAAMWRARAADGTIRGYMDKVTARG